jgi:hypothetical protein
MNDDLEVSGHHITEVLSKHLPGRTERKHEKLQSTLPVSRKSTDLPLQQRMQLIRL